MNLDRGKNFLSDLNNVHQDLPFSPVLVQKLFQVTGEDSHSSLDEIADLISRDQTLTAKVLSLANSAFYGLEYKVSSVSRAAAFLGVSEIRNMVMALGLKAFERKLNPGLLDILAYWNHQITVGLTARALGRYYSLGHVEELFTAGLLHDVGKLITAIYRPDDWRSIAGSAVERNISIFDAEEFYWGIDHGLVGAMTLQSWTLPPLLTEPINFHHAPHLAPDFGLEAKILCLADALAHHIQDARSSLPYRLEDVLNSLSMHLDDAVSIFLGAVNDARIASFLGGLTN